MGEWSQRLSELGGGEADKGRALGLRLVGFLQGLGRERDGGGRGGFGMEEMDGVLGL